MQLLEVLDGNHPQYLRRLENSLHWDRLYLPDLDSLSRGQMVSLSGLAPFNRESGKTRSRAFIQRGRAKVRKCLYMAAQSAAQHNDVIKTYVTRLMDAGQPYKSALVAAMRKILICLRSLLMNPKFRLA